MSQKVLILNGPPRCGKDEAMKALPGILGHSVYHLRFSRPLKVGGHALLGLTHAMMEDYDDCKDEPNDDFFGLTPREFYISISEDFLKPILGNDIMGRLWLREYLRVHEMSHSVDHAYLTICDLGFYEELVPLKNHFGAENLVILRIHRDFKDFANDSRGYIYDTDCQSIDVKNPEDDIAWFRNNLREALRLVGIVE